MQRKKSAGADHWTDPDDAPFLTKEQLEQAEVFDGDTFVRRGRGRPKSAVSKEQISVRIDRTILAKLREAGPGWQSQINTLLGEALGLATATRVNDEGKNREPAIAPAERGSVPHV